MRILNRNVIRRLGIPDDYLERVTVKELAEVNRRLRLLQGRQSRAQVGGRTTILVDDGLATGVTARAAVAALQAGPRRLILAAPVCAAQTARIFLAEVDELICLETPSDLGAIGFWYRDF